MIAFALANVLGLLGFIWPLLLGVGQPAATNQAHATDAPVLLALLVPLLIVVALRTAREEHADARMIALLGALVAINAFLRIPKGRPVKDSCSSFRSSSGGSSELASASFSVRSRCSRPRS